MYLMSLGNLIKSLIGSVFNYILKASVTEFIIVEFMDENAPHKIL